MVSPQCPRRDLLRVYVLAMSRFARGSALVVIVPGRRAAHISDTSAPYGHSVDHSTVPEHTCNCRSITRWCILFQLAERKLKPGQIISHVVRHLISVHQQLVAQGGEEK